MIVQLARWEPDNPFFWQTEGERIARRNLGAVGGGAGARVRGLDDVEHAGDDAAARRLPLHHQPAVLAGRGARARRRDAALPVRVRGAAGRRAARGRSCRRCCCWCPRVGFAVAVRDPATAYPTFLLLALACGIGGGNFASSMANISFFYPAERKGIALGTNAGLGNLGVPLAQFALPLVVASALFGAVGGAPQPWHDGIGDAVGVAAERRPGVRAAHSRHRRAGLALDGRPRPGARVDRRAGAVVARPDTWRLAWLYLGTLRFVHRLRRRLSAAGRHRLRGRRRRGLRLRRAARRGADAPAGRLARRPRRRGARGAGVLRRDGRGGGRPDRAGRPRRRGWRRSWRCSRCCSSPAASATARCSS